ncbi:MAG: helix-turn-helix transcriptional regulator [Gammaproteobacteria bacterium]|nr:helix-turn-helix transcriptional regulator [Gammaproteobacteria bacterium]
MPKKSTKKKSIASSRSKRATKPKPLANSTRNSSFAIEHHIGNVIRQQRNTNHLTINEVAELANISSGMLSRIERGDVSASLETLEKLATALGMPISLFFRDYDVPEWSAQHVKKGKGMQVVRRGTKKGHAYHLLAYEQGPAKSFEPFLITMDDASEEFPSFQHLGTEFIYVLKGKIEYRHGSDTYLLQPGDSLMFSGEVPHGPEKLVKVPIEILAIINYSSEY